MITRFRIEAQGDNDETVEDHLAAARESFLGHLRDVQPEDEWVETDSQVIPARNGSGDAVIFGRIVMKQKRDNDGY